MLSSFITLVFDTERHEQDKLCEESCRTKSSSVFGEITVDDWSLYDVTDKVLLSAAACWPAFISHLSTSYLSTSQ